MSVADFALIIFAVIGAAILIFGLSSPLGRAQLLWQIVTELVIPRLAKRATPEQEAAAQEDYRRGGDGNVPLPSQRKGRRKWLFGKGGIFSRD